MSLSELIVSFKKGEIAKATFAMESWYVIKTEGFIRYYNNGEIGEPVPLTYSNLNAVYEIIK